MRTLIIIISCLCCWAVGVTVIPRINSEPQVVTQTEYIDHIVTVPSEKVIEKPVYVDRVVEVEKIVEEVVEVVVIKHRDISVRQWEDLEQFKEWVQANLVSLTPMGNYKLDCDDYAMRLQEKALAQGYPLSCHLVVNGHILGKKVSDGYLHMGNLVIIGNDIYYVEPQPDDFKIVWLCNKDT